MILGCRASVGKNKFLNNRQRLGMIIRFLLGWVGWSKMHVGLKQTNEMEGYLGEQCPSRIKDQEQLSLTS